MKIKQLVMISLIVFSLGFMGVLIAGLALPEGTRLGGPANGVAGTGSGTVGDGAQLADGTPVITPHNDPTNAGGTTGNNPPGTGSNGGSGSNAGSSSGASAGGSTGSGSISSGATGGATGGGSGGSTGGGGVTSSTVTPKPSTSSPAPTTTVTPKPSTSTPPPAPACGSPGGVCSAAQVASHNASSNCWIIYNAGYYIVTSYVRAHPGGTAVFNSSTCGKDITAYLNGSAATAGAQHRHSSSAYTTLNSYYVGKVQ